MTLSETHTTATNDGIVLRIWNHVEGSGYGLVSDIIAACEYRD